METKKLSKIHPTVCINCKHFINKEPGSPRSGVWYNHLCGASPLPKKIDPFDGNMKSFSKNDLGQEYFTDDDFKFCRNVNKGFCLKFEPK